MQAWGWRVPFIIGALLGLYTLVARSRMAETEAFTAAKATVRPPIWPEIRRNWRRPSGSSAWASAPPSATTCGP